LPLRMIDSACFNVSTKPMAISPSPVLGIDPSNYITYVINRLSLPLFELVSLHLVNEPSLSIFRYLTNPTELS